MDQILHDKLERAIEQGLLARGRYVAELEPVGTQGKIDAQWAAHRAARSIGIRVKVTVREEPATTGRATAVLDVTSRA